MITTIYKMRAGDDPQALQLLRMLQARGYPLTAISLERVLRAEGISPRDLERMQPLFCNPVNEWSGKATALAPLADAPVVEVSYKRAVTDPELESVRHTAGALGIDGLQWARMATRYQLCGVDQATAAEIARRFLYNSQVQTLLLPGEEWETLVPQGQAGGVEEIDLAPMTVAALHKLSDERRLFLSDDQMLAIQRFFIHTEKRAARDAELEMVAARWSDHCGHTTWKAMGLLQALQDATRRINHPLVVEAFIGNSGVMRFYEGWAINIKGETHISPTFAGDPYGGIMTKHGGVIRDIIFTGQGAYPICGTTIMAICDPRIPWENVPTGAFHPLIVLKESIRGTHDYTNPMGIPMAWSQYLIHPRNWKGFALGHSIGILPESRAHKGKPKPGDFVVLIGGPTGIDGIHGATVSSGSMTSETVVRDAAHVQIGMPIEERKFMEAIPVLRDADCVTAETDCGAAGLESAVGELGEDTGVWVNLAWVPRKCASMREWEIWLSESQERGVLSVPPAKLKIALNILGRFGVPASVIGVFTNTMRCQVVYDDTLDAGPWSVNPTSQLTGSIVVDLPYSFLSGGCPLPNIEIREPQQKPEPFELAVPATEEEWTDLVTQALGHFNLADQSSAAHQFDQTVQGNTVVTYVGGADERMPDELFVSSPLRGKPYGAGSANAVNQYYGDIDPSGLGRMMMAGAAAKLVAAGFSPDDITVCANVYTPPVLDSPENAWRLKQLVKDGYIPASLALKIPVISGKDSSSGRFVDKGTGRIIDAPLTLDVLAEGRVPDAGKLIPKAFRQPANCTSKTGDRIVLYHPGYKEIHLGGSVLYDLYGQRGHKLSLAILTEMRSGWQLYHQWVASAGGATARSAICEGGLIRRLFEMCWGSGLGCTIDIPNDPLLWLFAELHGSILFTTDTYFWNAYLTADVKELGRVTEEPEIRVTSGGQTLFRAGIQELSREWAKTFSEVLQ